MQVTILESLGPSRIFAPRRCLKPQLPGSLRCSGATDKYGIGALMSRIGYHLLQILGPLRTRPVVVD